MDRNYITEITEANTVFIACQDDVVNEETKVSQDAHKISTTLNVYDRLTPYSTKASAATGDARTCRKRDLYALQLIQSLCHV